MAMQWATATSLNAMICSSCQPNSNEAAGTTIMGAKAATTTATAGCAMKHEAAHLEDAEAGDDDLGCAGATQDDSNARCLHSSTEDIHPRDGERVAIAAAAAAAIAAAATIAADAQCRQICRHLHACVCSGREGGDTGKRGQLSEARRLPYVNT